MSKQTKPREYAVLLVSTVEVYLPPDVAARPYRRAVRALYPSAGLYVYRGKNRTAVHVHVMMNNGPGDRRVDPKPWEDAEQRIATVAALIEAVS